MGEAHSTTTQGIFSGFGKTRAAATERFANGADITRWHCSVVPLAHLAKKELFKTVLLQSFPFTPGITEPNVPEAP